MSHNKKILWGSIAAFITVAVIVGRAALWAGDQRWATVERLELATRTVSAQVEQLEINSLDRQITFLQIKIQQGEATTAEEIYIETLRQQLRALKAAQ